MDDELSYRDAVVYGYTCLAIGLRPESRGNITLVSADPFDYPRISPNYLHKEYDIDILIKGDACHSNAFCITSDNTDATSICSDFKSYLLFKETIF